MDGNQRNTIELNRRNFLALALSVPIISYSNNACAQDTKFAKYIEDMLEAVKRFGKLRIPKYEDFNFGLVEYNKPWKLKPTEGSEVHKLARIITSEGGGYWRDSEDPTFMGLVADTVINRSKLTGQSIEKVITAPGQYSPVNPENCRHRVYLNPLAEAEKDPDNKRAWEVAWNTALQRIVEGSGSPVTHFLTYPYAKPQDWAKGKNPYVEKTGHIITSGIHKGQRELTCFYDLPDLIRG